MQVPFVNPKREIEICQEEFNQISAEALSNGNYNTQDQMRLLESEAAKSLSCKHALVATSRWQALRMVLRSLAIGEGDAVLLPALVPLDLLHAVAVAGVQPILLDLERDSLHMDPACLLRFLTNDCDKNEEGEIIHRGSGLRIGTILLQQVSGWAYSVQRLLPVAREFNLRVVEDITQCLGECASEDTDLIQAGTFGDISYCGLEPTSSLSIPGAFGLIFTSNDAIASRIRNQQPSPKEEIHNDPDISWLQFTMARAKLRCIDRILESRSIAVARYDSLIRNLGSSARSLRVASASYPYLILTQDATDTAQHCESLGVVVKTCQLAASEDETENEAMSSALLNANDLSQHAVALPLYAGISPQEQQAVVESLLA